MKIKIENMLYNQLNVVDVIIVLTLSLFSFPVFATNYNIFPFYLIKHIFFNIFEMIIIEMSDKKLAKLMRVW